MGRIWIVEVKKISKSNQAHSLEVEGGIMKLEYTLSEAKTILADYRRTLKSISGKIGKCNDDIDGLEKQRKSLENSMLFYEAASSAMQRAIEKEERKQSK